MPFESVPAEESASQGQKRITDVGPLFVANTQAAKLIKPTRKSVQPPSAIGPVHCHVRRYAWQARAGCRGHADLPGLPLHHNQRSTNTQSGRLAPVSWIASGTPRPSQIRRRLLPSLARSAGLGPICGPQKLLARNSYLRPRVTIQSGHGGPASLAKRSGSVARCLPPASPVTFASRSSPNRSSSPATASAKEFRFAVRTTGPWNKRGRIGVVCHLEAWASGLGVTVRSDSTRRREGEAWP